MYSLESLKIDLAGLKEGVTTFEYDLGDAYFEAVDAPEVRRGDVHVSVSVSRSGGVFRLGVHTEGTVCVPCDICLDDMEQPVSADNTLTARIGEEYSEDEDLITVGKDDPLLDISWFVYEFIRLEHPHQARACTWKMQPCHDKSSRRALCRPKRRGGRRTAGGLALE